ncbi:MAG: ribosome silencing factor [Deltaproteobacteria bacterium]|jgi:ribosome-associated protein|nr:ribosome silencing factor [Deltaproteobacteria bacterium]MBT4526632.1 ribosome silencing factor [Deltaproteobacteria bacterium]
MDTEQLLKTITSVIEDLKGLEVLSINVENKNAFADYMVLCHGTSSAHVKGISDKIGLTLKKEHLLPLGVEGYNEGQWVLMDYDAVIVHIFTESIRDAYQLEDLYKTTVNRDEPCEKSE